MVLPTDEDKEELLLSCRYGDIEDIEQFVNKFGPNSLNDVRDERGSSVLHMVCANGHVEALNFLLTAVSPSLLSVQNDAKSTALHWAALNSHLEVAKALVNHPKGPGKTLIDVKNAAGRSPLGEAENIGWEEGAKWLVEVMNLDDGENGDDELRPDGSGNIEIEIQDAEGQVAKMKLSDSGSMDGQA